MVARGAAYGDYDRDGDLDVLVTTNNGPARLLRNDGPRTAAVRVALRTGRRDAIGARITARMKDGTRRTQMVRTGSSYLSQSEMPLTFGLGPAGAIESAEVSWLGGKVEKLGPLAAGQTHVVEEGRGVVTRVPFSAQPAPVTTAGRKP
jgi:hypothetical protein